MSRTRTWTRAGCILSRIMRASGRRSEGEPEDLASPPRGAVPPSAPATQQRGDPFHVPLLPAFHYCSGDATPGGAPVPTGSGFEEMERSLLQPLLTERGRKRRD